MTMLELGAAVGGLSALGGLFGAGLAYASRRFHVEVDPRVARIGEVLPGANCGACGYAGCAAYAAAIVSEDAPIDLCTPGGAKCQSAVAAIMGREVSVTAEPMVARLHCNGGCRERAPRYRYVGIMDCKAADLLQGGYRSCTYGCTGLGTCARVCPFDAITMVDGLPVVDEEACTGCGICVRECPKDLFELVPRRFHVMVRCRSEDRGAAAKQVCDNPCIGCSKCAKACPVGAILVSKERWLAAIDYTKCTDCGECVETCPTKAIFDRRGRKALAGAAGDDDGAALAEA